MIKRQKEELCCSVNHDAKLKPTAEVPGIYWQRNVCFSVLFFYGFKKYSNIPCLHASCAEAMRLAVGGPRDPCWLAWSKHKPGVNHHLVDRIGNVLCIFPPYTPQFVYGRSNVFGQGLRSASASWTIHARQLSLKTSYQMFERVGGAGGGVSTAGSVLFFSVHRALL